MADSNRNIKVTLTANVDNYVAAMNSAKEATASFNDLAAKAGMSKRRAKKTIAMILATYPPEVASKVVRLLTNE